MIRRLVSHKQFRFLVIGGVNTLWGIASYPVLYFLLHPLGVNYVVVLVIAYVVSTTFSFTTQKYLVFRTKGNHFREFVKFISLQLGVLGVNLLALPAIVITTGWSPVIVQVVFAVAIAVISYFFHDKITFRGKTEK